jgi:chorismate mutase
MDEIESCRKKIDELDRQLVELISRRAECARQIGRLKRNTAIPIYEPEREKAVFANVCAVNRGPLPDRMLLQVYERLIDVMRQIQKEEIAPKAAAGSDQNELEAGIND